MAPATDDAVDITPVQLSIVIPALNEAHLLARAVREIDAHAMRTALPLELIVIDDGSTDGTWNVLRTLGREITHLRGVRLSRNFGKEAAICAGLDLARGNAAIIIDADLQHPPALIPEMVRQWQTGNCDIVEAVKSHRGRETWVHRVVARLFYRVERWLTGHDLQDGSDFKLLDRRVIDAWRQFGERATFFRGLVSWLGFERATIPFDVPDRLGGGSRWRFANLTGLAINALTSFSALPLQIVTALGLLTLLIAVGVGAQALRLWYQGTAVPGFTTVILLQLMLCGFLMLSLGIIGTYVGKIYDEIKGRPRYLVRDRIGCR
jgi:glycosyltransferase involved in cell wall biosynthesis